jgi:hypothetical protein
MKIKKFQEGGVPKVTRRERKEKLSAQDAAAREFMMQFMNSPMYKEMLTQSAEQGGQDPQMFMDARRQALENLPPTRSMLGERKTRIGQYDPNVHRISTYGDVTPEVNVHELSHATDLMYDRNGDVGLPTVDEVLLSSMANPIYAPFKRSYMEGSQEAMPSPDEFLSAIKDTPQFSQIVDVFVPKGVNPEEYFATEEGKNSLSRIYELIGTAAMPIETRARLNAMRFMGKEAGIYDPNTERLSREKLDEILNLYEKDPVKYQQIRQMRTMYTPQQIMEMMNRVTYSPEDRQSNYA